MNHAWIAYAIPLGLLAAGALADETARIWRGHAWKRAQRAQQFPDPEALHVTGTHGAQTHDITLWERELDTMPGLDMEDGERWTA